MRRLLRALVLLLLLCVVLAGAGIAYLYLGLPRDRVVADIAQRLEAETGRAVEITGTPEITLWPRPGILTGPVRIANAEWSAAETLVHADRGLVTVSIDGLLSGELRIGALHLSGGHVNLERDAQGRVNWPWTDTGVAWALDELRIAEARLKLRDPFLAAPLRLDRATLSARLGRGPRTATLQGALVQGAAAIDLDLRIGDLPALASGQWSRLSLVARGTDLSVDWRGQASAAVDQPFPYAQGRLEGEGAGLGALAAYAGLPGGLLSGAGLSGPRVEADLTVRPERLRLRAFGTATRRGIGVSLDLRLAGERGWQESRVVQMNAVSRAAGLYSAYLDGPVVLDDAPQSGLVLSASLIDLPGLLDWASLRTPRGVSMPQMARIGGNLGLEGGSLALTDGALHLDETPYPVTFDLAPWQARPSLTARVEVDTLDLSRLLSLGPGTRRVSLPHPADWPDNGMDTVVELNAANLRFGGVRAANAEISVARDGDGIRMTVPRTRMFGGEVTSDVRIAEADPPNVTATLTGRKLEMASVLSGIAGVQSLTGALAGDVQLTAQGRGLDAIEGTGNLSVFGGSLAGPSLVELSRSRSANDDGTDFAALSAELSLSGGQLTLQGLSLSTADAKFQGAVSVALDDAALSGRLLPVPQSVEVLYPLQIGGTLGRITAEAEAEALVVRSAVQPVGAGTARPSITADPSAAGDEAPGTSAAAADPDPVESRGETLAETDLPEDSRGPAESPLPRPAPR